MAKKVKVENNHKTNTKKENNTDSITILGWIFGIIIISFGIGGLFQEFILGLTYIFSGLIIFPPFGRFLYNKFNIKLKRWHRIVLFFIILFIGAAIFASIDINNEKNINTTTSFEKNKVANEQNNIKQQPNEVINNYISLLNSNDLEDNIENHEKRNDYLTGDLLTSNIKITFSKQKMLDEFSDFKDDCDYLNRNGIKYCNGVLNDFFNSFLLDNFKVTNYSIVSENYENGNYYVNVTYEGYSYYKNKTETKHNYIFVLENISNSWKIKEIKNKNKSIKNYYDNLSNSFEKLVSLTKEKFGYIKEDKEKIEKLNSEIRNIKLKISNNYNINYINAEFNNNKTNLIINYNFRDKGILSTDYLTAEEDASNIFEYIFSNHPYFNKIKITSMKNKTDPYGNVKSKKLSFIEMDKETYNKINWNNFDYTRLDEITLVEFYEDSVYKELKKLDSSSNNYNEYNYNTENYDEMYQQMVEDYENYYDNYDTENYDEMYQQMIEDYETK